MVGRINEAVMSFDVMDRYDVEKNVVVINWLLNVTCREENQTLRKCGVSREGYGKGKVDFDGDSFTILLEGWEKESNVGKV
jgi:hypothetical protein